MSFDIPYELFLLGLIFGIIFLFISLKLYLSKKSIKLVCLFSTICIFSFVQAVGSIAAIEQLEYNTYYGAILSHSIKNSKSTLCYDNIEASYHKYNNSREISRFNSLYFYFTFGIIMFFTIISVLFMNNKYLRMIFPVSYCVLVALCCIGTWFSIKTAIKSYYFNNYLYIAKTTSQAINENFAKKNLETRKVLEGKFYIGLKYSHENICAINNLLNRLPICPHLINKEDLNTRLRSITLLFNTLLFSGIICSLFWQRNLIFDMCFRKGSVD